VRPRRKNGTSLLLATPSGIKNEESVPRASPEVMVRVINDPTGLVAIEEKWNALVASSPVTVYQTYEWNAIWWKHFGGGPGQKLNILLFEFDGELIGIMPLLAESVRIAGLTAGYRLRFLSSGSVEGGRTVAEYGPSDYLDAIVPERYEDQVLPAFVKYITHLPRQYSQIYLSDIPEESVLVRRLGPSLARLGIPVSVSPSDLCPRIRVPESGELYLRSRKPEVRRRLRQVRISLAYQFSVRGTLSQSDADTALDALIKLHQDRWTSVGYPGVYSDPRFCRFQADMVSAYAGKKWLWLKSLSHEDRIVAVRLGFRFKGRFYDFMSGFESAQEVSRRRPGLALLSVMLDEAIQERADWLDLLRGNEAYKFDFATESRQNWKMVIRPNPHRMLSYAFFVIVLQWNKLLSRIGREHLVFLVHVRKHDSAFSAMWHYVAFVARRVGNHMSAAAPASLQKWEKGSSGKK
jgi:CelD/BcsL family acetyltransferase involved in cellulose biosynthesis